MEQRSINCRKKPTAAVHSSIHFSVMYGAAPASEDKGPQEKGKGAMNAICDVDSRGALGGIERGV